MNYMNQYIPDSKFWAGKKVVIVGVTGTLGESIVKELSELDCEILGLSRDEYKQYELNKKYPKVKTKIADIRVYESLESEFTGQDLVIHCAAMKDLVKVEENQREAYITNVIGTANVIAACLSTGIKKMLFVSTDKAEDPICYYGKTKQIAETKVLLANNARRTIFGVSRSGNIWNSRRSVINTFDNTPADELLKLTHKDMTRFFISAERCARFQLKTVENMGTVLIDQIATPEIYSCKMLDIVEKRYPNHEHKLIGKWKGEKIHETIDGVDSNDSSVLKDYPEILEVL